MAKKIEQKLNNTVEAALLLLENYAVSSSTLSSKDKSRYSKKCAKNRYVYLNENMINVKENEAENEKIDQVDTTQIDLGIDMDTNILNIKYVSI